MRLNAGVTMTNKDPLLLKKQKGKTGKRGGKVGNTNSQVHGAFTQMDLKRIDGRTKEGKAILAVKNALITAIGGDPTPQEFILFQLTSPPGGVRGKLYSSGDRYRSATI